VCDQALLLEVCGFAELADVGLADIYAFFGGLRWGFMCAVAHLGERRAGKKHRGEEKTGCSPCVPNLAACDPTRDVPPMVAGYRPIGLQFAPRG
jgi:hypothetical protein